MCLKIWDKMTEKIKKRFKTKKYLTFYKVVDVVKRPHHKGYRLEASIQYGYIYKCGENVASGHMETYPYYKCGEIDGGALHAYRTKKEALYNACVYDSWDEETRGSVVIPFQCKEEDFIAAGVDDVCVRRIYIPKKIYSKAINTKNLYSVVGK